MAAECERCDGVITGRADRRFCSPACRTAAHREKVRRDSPSPRNRGNAADSAALNRAVAVTEIGESGIEGDSTPDPAVTATWRRTGLSWHVVRALMAAGLEVPDRGTVDAIGYTSVQMRALDRYPHLLTAETMVRYRRET